MWTAYRYDSGLGMHVHVAFATREAHQPCSPCTPSFPKAVSLASLAFPPACHTPIKLIAFTRTPIHLLPHCTFIHVTPPTRDPQAPALRLAAVCTAAFPLRAAARAAPEPGRQRAGAGAASAHTAAHTRAR